MASGSYGLPKLIVRTNDEFLGNRTFPEQSLNQGTVPRWVTFYQSVNSASRALNEYSKKVTRQDENARAVAIRQHAYCTVLLHSVVHLGLMLFGLSNLPRSLSQIFLYNSVPTDAKSR